MSVFLTDRLTSTTHMRAKYFRFIPWTYQGLERKRMSSSEIRVRNQRCVCKIFVVQYQTVARVLT